MSDELRIITSFPKLATDVAFQITSQCDPNYNCIAWSSVKDNIWLWPSPPPRKEGTYWPPHLPCDTQISTFIQLYSEMGYEVCSDPSFEDGYQKIAIYVNPGTNMVEHAARQKFDGNWTSKLGSRFDIQHQDPFTVENSTYGEAKIFMRRQNSSYRKKEPVQGKKKKK